MALAEYMQPLKDEIINDPLGRGYSGMTDQEVADSLNTEDRQQARRVQMSELHEWANSKRVARRFFDESGNNLHPVLYTELMQLIEGKQESVNMQSSQDGVTGLIGDMVADGILTQTEAQDLQSQGIYFISRAQEIGFNRTVSAHAVSMCRS